MRKPEQDLRVGCGSCKAAPGQFCTAGCQALAWALGKQSIVEVVRPALPLETKSEISQSALDVQVGGGHYKDMKIQPVIFCQENRIPYMEANVIKYTCRHANKNGAQDIRKAIHYLHMILETQYGEKP